MNIQDAQGGSSGFDGSGGDRGEVRQLTMLMFPEPDLLVSPQFGELEELGVTRSQWASIAARSAQDWLATSPVEVNNIGPLARGQLEHALSPYFSLLAMPIDHQTERTTAENSVWGTLPPASDVIAMPPEFFASMLLKICAELGLPQGWRTQWVASEPDRQGNRIRYPAPQMVENGIARLHSYLSENYAIRPQLSAIVAFVDICTLHPLLDGNGRLARVAYNWLSDTGCDRLFYLPLYECGILSKGGQLIRVRQARYRGEWQPLIVYFASCMRGFIAENDRGR